MDSQTKPENFPNAVNLECRYGRFGMDEGNLTMGILVLEEISDRKGNKSEKQGADTLANLRTS